MLCYQRFNCDCGSTKAYLCSPLSYHVGDNLQYAYYGSGVRLEKVQYLQGHFLCYVFFARAVTQRYSK